MKSIRRLVVSSAATVLAVAGLVSVGTAPAQAAPGICYLTGYRNPVIGGNWAVPEYDLSYGMVDYCVSGLQRMLNRKYNAGLTVDSRFGPNTRTQVRRFQTDYRWCVGSVDGIAGPRTVSCLEAHVSIVEW